MTAIYGLTLVAIALGQQMVVTVAHGRITLTVIAKEPRRLRQSRLMDDYLGFNSWEEYFTFVLCRVRNLELIVFRESSDDLAKQ